MLDFRKPPFHIYFYKISLFICENSNASYSQDDSERTPILSASHDSSGSTREDGTTSSSVGVCDLTGLPSNYLSSSSDSANAPAPPPTSKADRSGKLLSLDVFRGFTIFLMIFVNYGGGHYYFFRHSPWNGLTVADLVFPWFVWIMGVSMMFSFRSQLKKGVSKQTITVKIFRRSIILFGLGLFVNGIHNSNVPTLRITGVLQRLGGCYFLTGIMEVLLFTDPEAATVEEWGGWYMFRDLVLSWVQWSIVFGAASIHTILTYVLMVPGCPRGYIGPGGLANYGAHTNCTGGAAAYIDKLILSPDHMYRGSSARRVYENASPHDPEGLLGYLTTILMLEFGVAAGRVLITFDNHKSQVLRLLAWALTSGLVGGVLCDFTKEEGIVPVNKNLWSLTYVLITACFAFVLFSLIYLITDWFKLWGGGPFSFAGYNSILLYVGHELTKGIFPFGWTPVGSSHGSYLLMNLWAASLWMLIAYACHRNKFYLSV